MGDGWIASGEWMENGWVTFGWKIDDGCRVGWVDECGMDDESGIGGNGQMDKWMDGGLVEWMDGCGMDNECVRWMNGWIDDG